MGPAMSEASIPVQLAPNIYSFSYPKRDEEESSIFSPLRHYHRYTVGIIMSLSYLLLELWTRSEAVSCVGSKD